MLNFFYLYAIIWSAILLVYFFGWSDLCVPLDSRLSAFFLITIIISIVLGFVYRKKFKFSEPKTYKNSFNLINHLDTNNRLSDGFSKHNPYITLGIVGFNFLEFIYCRQIPIVYILFNGGKYEAHNGYTGIPTLHTLVISFGSFYAQYLFYRFICNDKDKRIIKEYIIILFFIYMTQFNRGGLMISFFMSALLYLGKNMETIRAKINVKAILVGVAVAIIVLYGFGVMGNVRYGYAYNDSSYIEKLGRFNDNYPIWLPKQFMWPYIYIVSPIANINYNIMKGSANYNPIGFIMTLFPDFIVRRIYNGNIYEPEHVVKHVFNATPGFGTAYMNADIFGMYFLYFYMVIGFLFIWKRLPIKKEYRMPCLVIMDIIVIFMFFTHTLYYSAISFQLIFPVLSFIKLDLCISNSKKSTTM